MKTSYKISFIIALLLTSFIFLHLSFSFITDNGSIVPVKDKLFEEFYEEKGNVDYLFLGDSHTFNAINPAYISDNSYNYATPGESYVESYYRLKYLLENNVSIETVVLEVDSSMNDDLNQFERSLFFLNKYLDVKDVYEYAGLDLKTYLNYYFGFFGKGQYFAFLFYSPIKLNEQGYAYNNNKYSQNSNLNQTIVSKNVNTKVDLTYLKKILDLTNDNDVDIIAIKYPMTMEALNIVGFKNRYYSEVQTLLSQNSIELLDYERVYIEKDNYFADLSHLNTQGAGNLSILIKENLK